MTKTYTRRKSWIESDSPSVVTIFDHFPLLKKTKYVKSIYHVIQFSYLIHINSLQLWREFQKALNASGDVSDDPNSEPKWLELLPRAENMAAKESETRPAVKELLKKQKEELDLYMDDEDAGRFCIIIALILAIACKSGVTLEFEMLHPLIICANAQFRMT